MYTMHICGVHVQVTCLYLCVALGTPQVLSLSSEPEVTQEVAIKAGATGFCVEKAGETVEKHAHSREACTQQRSHPQAELSTLQPLRMQCNCTTINLYVMSCILYRQIHWKGSGRLLPSV